MLSTHIKKFNSLNGKLSSRASIDKFISKVGKPSDYPEVERKLAKELIDRLKAAKKVTPKTGKVRLSLKKKLDWSITKNEGGGHKGLGQESKGLDGIQPPPGFVRLDLSSTAAETTERTFRLPGQLGELLGDLQRFRLAIELTGESHGGKSEFMGQLIDGFADLGFTIGWFDLEHGGMDSKDTQNIVDRNIKPDNRKQIFNTGMIENGLEEIKANARQFDVVVIDSWAELDEHLNTSFNSLRKEFPETIFVVIFHLNGKGTTKGGTSADYSAPVRLKVHRVDDTFVNNYVQVLKNRGNRLDLAYRIHDRKVLPLNELLTEL